MASSLNRRQPKQPKQELDLRYSSTPLCECKIKADIRIVESDRKPSKGKLYYCCPNYTCGFFRWCKPFRATWHPIGTPVVLSSDFGVDFVGESELPRSEEDAEDAEEVIFAISGMSRVVGSGTGDVNGNYVHISWFNVAAKCRFF
ncbi:hypothetical protein BUALT_Bualt06G0072400 [Buddleja alternifolia]|uniref:GRF-type domain-containing protein n=1 Tax=Buddleja alternifolia TaxID=168488 RepID=A0AAV6XDK2_9LAMI|nr:hypothetical protein BUALT_Bualt06G0072400 [Buddleja alternifolia]